MKKNSENKFNSIREMLEDAVRTDPLHIAYTFREDGGITSITNAEFYESIENLGARLTELGFGASHIACVGPNSYPWIRTFLCVLMSAGVFVPLDSQLPADDLIFLLNESDSEVVFCAEKYARIFRERRSELPKVQKFIVFGQEEHDGDGEFLSIDKLTEEGKRSPRLAYDLLASDENELKYLVFTSGTTGIAKGVMLTEHNIVSGIYYGMQVSNILTKGLSVLPYNHTYEAVCDILVAIRARATVCINDSVRRVQENLKRFRPDYIMLVPAFAEHFHNLIQTNIRKKGMERKFSALLTFSNALRVIGIDLRRKFFASILDEFGGNLKKIVCGGAPIRPEIGKFFDGIGISLTGGYGITECSPLVSVNDDKDNNFASAGHRLPCLEWKIDGPDDSGIGEICVKGDVVMKGYYKRPDLTAEAIRDGWFYTGDYGYINEKDEIVITGRKKNIVVLNNGKNVYPEELEMKIGEIPYVTEVVVRGITNEHGQETGLSAEVYIENENDRSADLSSDIRKKLAALPSYKQITSVVLRDTPFDKTTTNKIKRK